MAKVIEGRKTLKNDRDLVVFIIGARINKWWLLPFVLPILAKMRRMLQELLSDPLSGLLAVQSLGTADVQYWRSVEDLHRYAADRSKQHQPAAKRYFQKIFTNRAAGVWHETYLVQAGKYECIYTNMPRIGLGQTAPLVDASGGLATARGRLAAEKQSAAA